MPEPNTVPYLKWHTPSCLHLFLCCHRQILRDLVFQNLWMPPEQTSVTGPGASSLAADLSKFISDAYWTSSVIRIMCETGVTCACFGHSYLLLRPLLWYSLLYALLDKLSNSFTWGGRGRDFGIGEGVKNIFPVAKCIRHYVGEGIAINVHINTTKTPFFWKK